MGTRPPVRKQAHIFLLIKQKEELSISLGVQAIAVNYEPPNSPGPPVSLKLIICARLTHSKSMPEHF